ncbi:MAG: hypothetical protein A3F78_15225 [Burkholderiales bacterium RIFCSPLOWO2_12_FULL_61_40]|nr:MAG: hypothetical protein A3F78_15225 [Burkholderiales bacterium RIFCSPLOWO2_12_FULL_61_40]
MSLSKVNKQVALKTLLATVLLVALAGVAGAQLAPEVPLQWVLIYSALGAAALLLVLAIATVVTLTVMQFILRKGGTDTQWLWFSAEPRGLVHLRAQASEAQTKAGKCPKEHA